MKFAIFALLVGFSSQAFAALDCSEATMKAREEQTLKLERHIDKLNRIAKQSEQIGNDANEASSVDVIMLDLRMKTESKAQRFDTMRDKLMLANLQCEVKALKEKN